MEFVKYLNDNSSLTNVLAEIDGEGNAVACYTIGDDVVSQDRNGRTSFYLYDGHGSVVGLANENGVVTDTYVYDAFGNLLDSTGSTGNCYRYCGEQFDETTSLYYLRARYMDTTTGRFISQDSYAGSIDDPTSLHKYLYANANPVMYTDPSGYMSVAGMAVAGAISGALSGIIVPNVLSMLKSLDTTGVAESILSPIETIQSAIQGMIFGALFGVMIVSGFAYIVAGITLFGGVISAINGFNEYKEGNYRTAIAYSILSIVSFICGLCLFKTSSVKNGNNNSKPRTFESSDPLVGELANRIEREMPGSVIDVNVKSYRPDGSELTDFDIELNNVIIQVKSGGGKKLTSQLIRTSQGTDKIVIGYGPEIKGSVIKSCKANNYDVFTSFEELINFLKGLE